MSDCREQIFQTWQRLCASATVGARLSGFEELKPAGTASSSAALRNHADEINSDSLSWFDFADPNPSRASTLQQRCYNVSHSTIFR
jgi:hypothetical protein